MEVAVTVTWTLLVLAGAAGGEPEDSGESARAPDLRPASVRLAEGDATRPWGLLVQLKHSLGTGVFLADDTLRQSRSYVAQAWNIRPSYAFDAWGHRLRVSARLLFEIEYTEPDGNPPRRFSPRDASIGLSDTHLYTEPGSGVRFNAGLRWYFPTSYESLNVTRRWGALTLLAGASRTFGPVYLSYGLSFTKNFNSSKGLSDHSDVAVRTWGAGVLSGAGAVDPGTSFPDGLATSFSVTNSFTITYNIDESLSVSYSLMIWNLFEYTQDNVNTEDELTSPFADAGRGRSDLLWPTLDVTWALNGVLEPLVHLPFSLLVSAGITARHPAQTANNGDLMWPFFYPAFADSRAAENYGSVFIDITGVY
jgi:hypothetical protein